jgi:hypothetical protein
LLRLHGHPINTANIFDISPLFNTMLPQTKHYLGRCFRVVDPAENEFEDENVQHKFEVLQMKPFYPRKESSLSSNNGNTQNGNSAQVLD